MFFFFNDPAPPEIYTYRHTLSLHDALPIFADYRPIETRERKIKKRDAGKELNLRMTENPDILKAIVSARRPGAIVVGFKAETGDATAEAERMLDRKSTRLNSSH